MTSRVNEMMIRGRNEWQLTLFPRFPQLKRMHSSRSPIW